MEGKGKGKGIRDHPHLDQTWMHYTAVKVGAQVPAAALEGGVLGAGAVVRWCGGDAKYCIVLMAGNAMEHEEWGMDNKGSAPQRSSAAAPCLVCSAAPRRWAFAMENGEWAMGNGQWRMENGERMRYEIYKCAWARAWPCRAHGMLISPAEATIGSIISTRRRVGSENSQDAMQTWNGKQCKTAHSRVDTGGALTSEWRACEESDHLASTQAYVFPKFESEAALV